MSWWSENITKPWQKLGDGLSGKADRDRAKAEAAKADSRYARADNYRQEGRAIADRHVREQRLQQVGLQNRYDTMYRPMEQELVAELQGGPALEQEAAIAANRFGNDFDRSADSARREAMRYGIEPGSEQARRTADANTYDRARGIAGAANEARRAEDDAHWMKKATFFGQNGSGLHRDVLSGLQNIYATEYNANQDVIGGLTGEAQRYQNNSNQYSQQAAATLSATTNLATQAALAWGTGGASLGYTATQRSKPQAVDTGGAPVTQRSRPQAIDTGGGRTNGPSTGSFMDGSGYSQVAGNGANGNASGNAQGAINWREAQ